MARHPSEASLALYAGGDLGWLRKQLVERHVARCSECGRDVTEFSALRQDIRDASEVPAVDWNRAAAEMRANIRLGLEAGACVDRTQAGFVFSPWALAACATLVLLAALLVGRPEPRAVDAQAQEPAVLEASRAGIQVKEGGQALMLLNPRARNVSISYSASGSAMRARYIDPDTGYVTINNVYVQ